MYIPNWVVETEHNDDVKLAELCSRRLSLNYWKLYINLSFSVLIIDLYMVVRPERCLICQDVFNLT